MKIRWKVVALLGLVPVLTFGLATAVGVPAANASCAANSSNTYVYVPDGTTYVGVSFYPTTYFLNSSVVFDGAGYNQYDTWSAEFHVVSSTQYWNFAYLKTSSPANAYFQVTHC